MAVKLYGGLVVVVCLGRLVGAGHAGCSHHGPGWLCQTVDRQRYDHEPFPDRFTSGGAL